MLPSSAPGEPRAQKLDEVGTLTERMLLGLSRVDARLLRRHDLPFGSSVLVAASKAPAGSSADPSVVASPGGGQG